MKTPNWNFLSGTIEYYNAEKYFGAIRPDGGGKLVKFYGKNLSLAPARYRSRELPNLTGTAVKFCQIKGDDDESWSGYVVQV